MSEQTVRPGCLYVVATPLGNLADITFRAVDILRAVDTIACEDTRHSRKLFQSHRIDSGGARLIAYHEHNEREAAGQLISRLERGESVALVTDAGTPGISDPGYRLTSLAADRGIPVVPVPGPSAITAALSVAGLPTDSFYFAGFPPPKQQAAADSFRELAEVHATLVFYCPARRLVKMLRTARDQLGDRPAAVCRELTKLHEEVARGTLGELAGEFDSRRDKPRGEVVVLVGGASQERKELSRDELATAVEELLGEMEDPESLGARKLTALAAEKLDQRRNRLYPLVCAWLNRRKESG